MVFGASAPSGRTPCTIKPARPSDWPSICLMAGSRYPTRTRRRQAISPARVNQLDSAQLLVALQQIDAVYHAPVALFYLEDYAYKEIAEILDIPMGTVKSRISRGIAQLQQALAGSPPAPRPQKGVS